MSTGHVASARDLTVCAPPSAPDPASPTPSVPAGKMNEIPFPLNSRRLTSFYRRSIAKAIVLPTAGTAEETRVIIDGRLTEMEQDPQNVQVVVRSSPHGETLSLRDVDGPFVDTTVALEDPDGGDAGGGGDGEQRSEPGVGVAPGSPRSSRHASEGEELDALRAENESLLADKQALSRQVSSLREKVCEVRDVLKGEHERLGEMWRMNCAQVACFDEAIITKEKEIDSLTSRVAELEAWMDAVLLPVLSTWAPASSSTPVPTPARRGKAPVNEFSGEDLECLLDDWLPSLNHASLWNGCSEEE